MILIPALKRLKQRGFHEVEDSLGYVVNCKASCSAVEDPVSKTNELCINKLRILKTVLKGKSHLCSLANTHKIFTPPHGGSMSCVWTYQYREW